MYIDLPTKLFTARWTFCCSYELTHGHAYSVFKYQLLLLRSPKNFLRGETIDYTEPNLHVNRSKQYFQTFFSLRSNITNSATFYCL